MDEQQKLFQKAFDYVVGKKGAMNLGTAICCFEDESIGKDDKFAVGWSILSLLEQRADEFDAIQAGLTNKMKEKIVLGMC